MVVVAIAFVDMDAVDLDTGELYEVSDDGAKRVAVEGIAVQGLGVQHELPALGSGHRGGDRDLAPELVRGTCLAAADALHFGSVQGIDLWAHVDADPDGAPDARERAIGRSLVPAPSCPRSCGGCRG
jgi:hypothetical protein